MSVLVLVQKSTPVGRCLLASCKSKGSLMTRRSFSPMAWYNKQLKRAPLVTKSITSGILFGSGDVIAQVVVGNDRFDIARFGRAWIFGTFLLGPLSHLHFNFLEWLVVRKLALQGNSMSLAKMFVDQFTYWAAGINTIYLFTLPKLEGRSVEDSVANVKERLWDVLKANWMVWPVAQFVNFRFIPVPHQLNFVLIVSLFWATYLSWFNKQKDKQKVLK
ncbi:uncharacterized protein LOC135349981 [Halichondria panicea]|uniref:uncharacterized protein LOC135349981 n=1 Tax=Halichondria panicea TaxID=6063 RepID=UPI00312BA19F